MIQETQTNSLLDILKWLIPSGSVFALLTYFWAKYFRIRPKVRLTVKWGGASSSPRNNDGFEFEYTPKLVLHNDSIFVARRITIVQSSDIKHWRFREQLPGRIEGDHHYDWEFTIRSLVSRDQLVALFGDTIAKSSPSQQYFPHALGNATLILSYDNEKDKTFYTLFKLTSGESVSEFRWRRPKLK